MYSPCDVFRTVPEIPRYAVADSLVLVTGGLGFLGRRLSVFLARSGARVHLLDIGAYDASKLRRPTLAYDDEFSSLLEKGRISLHVGSIASAEDVSRFFSSAPSRSAFDKVAVIHIASFGMSGREQFDENRILRVNVLGTLHIANECLLREIPLVYTSTTNVVFHSSAIAGDDFGKWNCIGKESPLDPYSRTKTIAEVLLWKVANEAKTGQQPRDIVQRMRNLANQWTSIAACAHVAESWQLECDSWPYPTAENGCDTHCENSALFNVICLRSAGIYGEGEERHFARFLDTVERGVFKFLVGSPDAKCEFVHVDNLAHAHALAICHLFSRRTNNGSKKSSWNAYFVSESHPDNNFSFFKPVTLACGHSFPPSWSRIPVSVAYFGGLCMEHICRRLNMTPLLTRHEVLKIGVEHWFSQDRVCKELGYSPIVDWAEGRDRNTFFWMARRGRRFLVG
eukprot:ANDGO_00502.mRNA.1 3 beta-hydroxysteroid dehydrogenase/Delta 5-->4-isomerase